MKYSNRRRRGLTDILTLVAIMAILIAIILPALSVTRRKLADQQLPAATTQSAAAAQPPATATSTVAQTSLLPAGLPTVAIITALLAAGAWSYRRVWREVQLDAQGVAEEVLSDGRLRSRDEVARQIKARLVMARLNPGTASTAVRNLLLRDRVEVVNGSYRIRRAR